MSSTRQGNHIIDDLKRRIVSLEASYKALRNNPVITLPLRDQTNLPDEAGAGELILAKDGKAYKFQDDEWTPVGGVGVEVCTTPGRLSVFEGEARNYMNSGGTINLVHGSVGVLPDGYVVFVLKNSGVEIGTGTISGDYFTTFVPDPATFVAGDYFTVDIQEVGQSPDTGRSLVVKIF